MEIARHVIVEMVNRPVTGVASRWVSAQWGLGRVIEASDALIVDESAPQVFVDAPETLQFGGLQVSLHKSEGEGYWLNLNSPQPCLFVMWRQEEGESPVPWIVTASYNEAGRMLDAGEKVENAPLPESMLPWLKAYTDAHYVPEVRKKVKRNDPFARKNGGDGNHGSRAPERAQ